jgi:capsular polysaccharide biosynthesis protein
LDADLKAATAAAIWTRAAVERFLLSGAVEGSPSMNNPIATMLYLALMVAVIVGVDLAFFRHHLWPRLTVNVGIVLVSLAFYFRFFGRIWPPWK